MIKDISQFKDCCKGAEIWVIGSGATMKHIKPYFFSGKITIAMNEVGLFFPASYVVCHHFESIYPNIEKGNIVIAPKHDQGFPAYYTLEEYIAPKTLFKGKTERLFYFNHGKREKGDAELQYEPQGEAALAMATGCMTEALSFAEYLGAKSVILCGIDVGKIDGADNFTGYPTKFDRYELYRSGLVEMAKRLRAKGISVHSLNPFAGLFLEGHKYQ